jgi:serine/threonine-protein kinase HipA
MTMLEASDGDQRSYLEIADVIMRTSPHATADLHELWRRVAFSVAISNTDDHLRNHGFLRESTAGWSLAPAFDLNPNPRSAGVLSTTIDFDDPTASADLLRSVAGEFRLGDGEAAAILAEVDDAVGTWREVAAALDVRRGELGEMEAAFGT